MGLTRVPLDMTEPTFGAAYVEHHTPNQSWSYTANTYADLDSFVIAPGTYDVDIILQLRSNGATTTGDCHIGLGTTTGNVAPDLGFPAIVTTKKRTASNSRDCIWHHIGNFEVTSSTTYYLKGYASTSNTNLQFEIIAMFRPI